MNFFTAAVISAVVASSPVKGPEKAPASVSVSRGTDPLVSGVMAIRGHFKHVTRKFATQIVREVRGLLKRPGNGWLRASDLLALAINESDLRPWLQQGLDCGITQVRVNAVRRSYYKQRKLCRALAASTRLAFEHAIAVLNRIHHRYCWRWTGDQHYRCLMNTYFEGPSVRNRRRCKKPIRYEWSTNESISKRYGHCVHNNRYWLRHRCFAVGLRLGRKARYSCRRAKSLGWIALTYRRSEKAQKQASLVVP